MCYFAISLISTIKILLPPLFIYSISDFSAIFFNMISGRSELNCPAIFGKLLDFLTRALTQGCEGERGDEGVGDTVCGEEDAV